MTYELIVKFSIVEAGFFIALSISLLLELILLIRKCRNLKIDLVAEKMKSELNRAEAEGWWNRYCEAKGIGGKL